MEPNNGEGEKSTENSNAPEKSRNKFFKRRSSSKPQFDQSRRDFLKNSGLAALGIGASAAIGKNLFSSEKSAPEPTEPKKGPEKPPSPGEVHEKLPSPEVLPDNSTQYDFSTPVYLN